MQKLTIHSALDWLLLQDCNMKTLAIILRELDWSSIMKTNKIRMDLSFH